MGFLSNLFGGNKEDKALREAMAHIHRIPRLAGHAVGPLVIVDRRHCQTDPLAGMMTGLGHDPATGAATDHSRRR